LVATGDVNGDGIPDYAIATRAVRGLPGDSVVIQSGRDDQTIWSVRSPPDQGWGGTMIGNLDVDGDGRVDLVVGAMGENQREGAVYVFDHLGQLRYRLSNQKGPFSYFGSTLVSLGDVDRDGGDDFVVGYIDPEGRGTHLVYSGRTRQVLSTGMGAPGEGLWQCADHAGDVDQDGVSDYVVGNSYGIVRLFSGRTGATIWRWQDPQQWYANLYGSAVAGGVDLDRDGIPDVIVVASNEFIPGGGWGAVYLYSGRDGSLLRHFPANYANRFPWAVLSVPPQPAAQPVSPYGLFLLGQAAGYPGGRPARPRGFRSGGA
jgi:hypothetical protein